MVDVGEKPVTRRAATAAGRVKAGRETIRLIQDKKIPKGDCLTTAKIAGILAAKRTHELIPMCHPLPLECVDVDFRLRPDNIDIVSTVKVTAKTGVEMEALTAVAVAALTIYDMCKSVDRAMVISDIRLVEKTGGTSGRYRRKGEAR